MLKGTIAILLLAGAGTGFAESNAAPELMITKIEGRGDGCKRDAEGKPTNWRYLVNNTEKAFNVAFEGLMVEGDKKASKCKIRVTVEAPEGTTSFTYGAITEGSAEFDDGESAKLGTSLRMERKSKRINKSYNLREDSDGDWKTPLERTKGKFKVPCGGKKIQLRFDVDLALKGSDSFAEVTVVEGQFTNIRYRRRKCN